MADCSKVLGPGIEFLILCCSRKLGPGAVVVTGTTGVTFKLVELDRGGAGKFLTCDLGCVLIIFLSSDRSSGSS